METIDQRTKAALDEITGVLKDVSQDEKGRLAIQGLLDDTGFICERKGLHPAEVFVIGKRKDSAYEDKQKDLDKFINIIKILKVRNLPRSEASYIIKKLDAIKQFYTPDC